MDVKCVVECMVKARKLKLKDLGQMLGYKSSGSVSMLLSRKGMSVGRLMEIAEALGYYVVLRPVPGQPGPEFMLDER